jgi:hypothetical protein
MARRLNLTLSEWQCSLLLGALLSDPRKECDADTGVMVSVVREFLRDADIHSVHVDQLSIMEAALRRADNAV